ncbi:MAG TPA: hypothetical protein VE621_20825 [Bryobacteraceae bacterium]|jgi:hypothetical protein|nr:hypothetical protein [Bryobacteraceae bacterium]
MLRPYILSVLLLASAASVKAASLPDPSPTEVEEIIRKFAAKESEFRRARDNYTYRQTARIQEMDEGGYPGGKYEIVEDIIFNADGRRTQRVVRAPATTLRNIVMTPEDQQDLQNVLPFVLTSEEIDKYNVRYLGRQLADEIPAFVFAVRPKRLEQGQRYFAGLIWVDDRDLQIVKTYGRSTGLTKKGFDQQFPKFETYREQVDGKYWFPTYTIANSILRFQTGPQPIKMSVKYEDYKQFKSDVKITFGGEASSTPETAPKEPPKKQ